MNTNKRLDEAYRAATTLTFDQNSKFIIFSDLHRGDDSISDEFTRNQNILVTALEYYYRNGYTYIEAGDGDELWEYSQFRYIRSAHSDVFTTIRKFFLKNRFYMLYGNHNIHLKNPDYVKRHYYYFNDEYTGRKEKLFYGLKVIESLKLVYKENGQEILIVHGHQGDLLNDQLWRLTMLSLRYFWRYLHLVGLKNPASPSKNQTKQHYIEKNYSKWIALHNKILICGHTHRLKFPLPGEIPYFNSGCCIHTKGVTGLEILGDKILLVQWRIKAKEDGTMVIIRHVVRGPESIEDYVIAE